MSVYEGGIDIGFKKSRCVKIGGKGKTKFVNIGGDNPISIQTMWKEGIISLKSDAGALLMIERRIADLELLGCDIIRFAVPDMESAESLLKIAECVSVPLVADIHFDYQLALRCMDGCVAKIRINPGNIGSRDKVQKVIDKARSSGTAIRIGINSGSLPHDLNEAVASFKISRSDALVCAAEREMAYFDEAHFSDIIVSMKASSVAETVACNETFARRFDVPLHIGVTEAGPIIGGVVKSTLAFNQLLPRGIGSTVRVSLSSDIENEVIAAREILSEVGMRTGGVKIVSCPRCGRNGFDVHAFIQRWEHELFTLKNTITVAVMGCVVNGPGEAKHADIGITGAGNSVIIFKHGKIVRTVEAKDADIVFREELQTL